MLASTRDDEEVVDEVDSVDAMRIDLSSVEVPSAGAGISRSGCSLLARRSIARLLEDVHALRRCGHHWKRVVERTRSRLQALGGMVKGSRDNVYVSLPSSVEPKLISPLHLLHFNMMLV
jgi:hypothetical protein